MKYLILILTALLGAMTLPPTSNAQSANAQSTSAQNSRTQSEAIYTGWRDNLALGGYDSVSFFTGKAQMGKSDYSFMYKGALWHFTSETHLEMFKEAPEDFAPQYGGYCAWAVAKNKLAKGDPKFWRVVDGKLYINFNARIQKRWDRKHADFITQANRNWPGILDK